MSRCEYNDPDSPAPHLNCCDSFNSSSAEFAQSCTKRLGGKVHTDGGCNLWDLPWLPEDSPGRWRGSCAVIPSLTEDLLDIIDTAEAAIYDAPDILGLDKRIEHDGKTQKEPLHPALEPHTPAHKTKANIDGKIPVLKKTQGTSS